jgi:D-amino-acid dehydrogenase
MKNVQANADALRCLLLQTFDAYAPLIHAAQVPEIVRRSGCLVVYESDAEYQADALAWRLRRERGVTFDVLDGEALRKLEPALSAIYRRGVYLHDQGYVTSPLRLTQSIAEEFLREGGHIEKRTVWNMEVTADGPQALYTDGGVMPVEELVVAAGVHSARFSGDLGEPVLLEAERGYHVEFQAPGISLAQPVNSAKGKFFVSPMETGLRVAGTTEFVGLDRPANPDRVGVLLKHARRMFPDLKDEPRTDWMGQRPSTPDYLPVISRSTRFRNVYYAFGHGHLGVVAGAPTGRIIADFVAGRSPAIDVRPYRIDRF